MAESIYVQLDNQKVTTPVNGIDYNHSLPEGLFPTAIEFESSIHLIEWANNNDFTAKLIQKGLQKAIIEVRACFKSCPKDKEWTEEMGLANLDKLEWKTVDRPNAKGTKKVNEARFADCLKMITTLTGNGMDEPTIIEMVTPIYGDEIVEAVTSAIKTLNAE